MQHPRFGLGERGFGEGREGNGGCVTGSLAAGRPGKAAGGRTAELEESRAAVVPSVGLSWSPVFPLAGRWPSVKEGRGPCRGGGMRGSRFAVQVCVGEVVMPELFCSCVTFWGCLGFFVIVFFFFQTYRPV